MNGKKKVLITYATAGIGHRKAAQAIAEAFESKHREIEVKLIDVLDYTNLIFKEAYCVIYLFLVNRFTFLWGFLYYSFNFKFMHFLFHPLRRAVHILNSRRFIKFLMDYKPDIVVSAHFLPADICYYLKKKHKMNMHVINVITDYRAHSFWVSSGVDTYIVGHSRVKEELVNKWGREGVNIKVFGIPVEPKFSIMHNRTLLKERLGIKTDSFTVLLLSGGYGVGPVVRILEMLDKASFPLAAIAVSGHNKKLHKKVEVFRRRSRIRILNLGFVNNIDELMAASDICIGKAGGISTSEAFSQDLPFIFVKPIPGQEMANADLFTHLGMAIRLKKMNRLLEVVEGLKFSPGKMALLREKIKRVKSLSRHITSRNLSQRS